MCADPRGMSSSSVMSFHHIVDRSRYFVISVIYYVVFVSLAYFYVRVL